MALLALEDPSQGENSAPLWSELRVCGLNILKLFKRAAAAHQIKETWPCKSYKGKRPQSRRLTASLATGPGRGMSHPYYMSIIRTTRVTRVPSAMTGHSDKNRHIKAFNCAFCLSQNSKEVLSPSFPRCMQPDLTCVVFSHAEEIQARQCN
eukprot:1136446-Pelagomonas_calceolata.AAC.2